MFDLNVSPLSMLPNKVANGKRVQIRIMYYRGVRNFGSVRRTCFVDKRWVPCRCFLLVSLVT